MQIKSEVRGTQGHQIDQTLYVEQEGKVAAYLNFSEYRGEVAVQMLRVADAFKRRGLGSMLLRDLQARYPDTEIDLGGLTDDGAALISSLDFRTVENPEVVKKHRLHDRVREKLAVLEQLPVEKQRTMGDVWNRLNDLDYRLENELAFAKPSRRIII